MTPKEKAQELFIEYRYALSLPNAPLGDQKDGVVKQCALIAADKILNIVEAYESTYVKNPKKSDIYEYWEEVKYEIEII